MLQAMASSGTDNSSTTQDSMASKCDLSVMKAVVKARNEGRKLEVTYYNTLIILFYICLN